MMSPNVPLKIYNERRIDSLTSMWLYPYSRYVVFETYPFIYLYEYPDQNNWIVDDLLTLWRWACKRNDCEQTGGDVWTMASASTIELHVSNLSRFRSVWIWEFASGNFVLDCSVDGRANGLKNVLGDKIGSFSCLSSVGSNGFIDVVYMCFYRWKYISLVYDG